MIIPDNVPVYDEYDIVRLPSGVEGSDTKDDIRFTHKALDMITETFRQNNVPDEYRLRLVTKGGGCSGMQYEMEFDAEVNDADRTFEVRDIPITVNSKSLFYLMGVTVDYKDSIKGTGFVFAGYQNLPMCGGCHG